MRATMKSKPLRWGLDTCRDCHVGDRVSVDRLGAEQSTTNRPTLINFSSYRRGNICSG